MFSSVTNKCAKPDAASVQRNLALFWSGILRPHFKKIDVKVKVKVSLPKWPRFLAKRLTQLQTLLLNRKPNPTTTQADSMKTVLCVASDKATLLSSPSVLRRQRTASPAPESSRCVTGLNLFLHASAVKWWSGDVFISSDGSGCMQCPT